MTKATVASNKKAFFDYQVLDQLEAGIVLTGAEIKAIRAGRVNISGSYVKPLVDERGNWELWWLGGHLSNEGKELTDNRKLLLKRQEIDRLLGQLQAKGKTLIPLELGLKRGLAKLKIGLATRKSGPDKREAIKKRDLNRELGRG